MARHLDAGADIVGALIRSDHLYFNLGAEIAEVEPGVNLVQMKGLTHMPVGCLAVCDPDATPSNRAVRTIEERVRALGGDPIRIYTGARSDAGNQLNELGYSPRLEIAFAGKAGALPPDPYVMLRPLLDAREWSDKLAIHEAETSAPDGYAGSAADWVRMERRKCEAGGMIGFIIESGGAAVGAVCALEVGDFLRMKNLLVHPYYRRRGVARGTASRFSHLAAERGCSTWGCFAVEGGYGETLYRRVGLEVVGGQVEWTKPCL